MKVLFVKLGAIGDVAIALAILPALEATYPGATLTWMCGRGVEPLLRLFPQVHELIVVNDRALFAGSKLAALRELLGLQKRLLGRRYDLVLHGNVDWRYRLLTATVLAGERRGWNRSQARPWPIAGRYYGDEYVRLITQTEDFRALRWNLPRPQIDIPQSLRNALNGPGRLVALAPGGAKNLLSDGFLRRWPIDSYKSLAQSLVQRGDRLLLVGSESDKWVLPAFENIPHIDLVGKTSLAELLAVFSLATVVVSHDTSSLHLPRLVGTPVVALFGPTMPSQPFPADANGLVIWGGKNLACRPCYDGRGYAPCQNNVCMSSISISEVLAAVDQVCGSVPR